MKGLVILFFAGLFFLFYIFTSDNKPEYIRRDFKNDRSIEVEVDHKLSIDDWDCVGNCSGHWAGYDWADRNSLYEAEDCGGNSESFIEGCITYANEN